MAILHYSIAGVFTRRCLVVTHDDDTGVPEKRKRKGCVGCDKGALETPHLAAIGFHYRLMQKDRLTLMDFGRIVVTTRCSSTMSDVSPCIIAYIVGLQTTGQSCTIPLLQDA